MVYEIDDLDRVQNSPQDGPLCDFLWSDAVDKEGWSIRCRGGGYNFGADISRKFNVKNDLAYIIKGHELFMDGYKYRHEGELI
mgnify:CR=1 FL=1